MHWWMSAFTRVRRNDVAVSVVELARCPIPVLIDEDHRRAAAGVQLEPQQDDVTQTVAPWPRALPTLEHMWTDAYW